MAKKTDDQTDFENAKTDSGAPSVGSGGTTQPRISDNAVYETIPGCQCSRCLAGLTHSKIPGKDDPTPPKGTAI